MKIAHLSTGTSGGAAVTAKSIARIQHNFGHEVKIFSRRDDLSLVELAKSKLSTFISLTNASKEYVQLTHFSNLSADLDAIRNFNADVIFVHNWFNLLREEDIVSISHQTPIVFVAHDARLATGGCHVTLGCQKFKSGCQHCPAARIDWFTSKGKRSLESMVGKLGKYAIVTPSRWLMSEITKSSIVSESTIARVIANPSDAYSYFDEHKPLNTGKRLRLIFVAASLNSSYKGFDIFMESLYLLDSSSSFSKKIEISIIGEGRWEGSKQLSSDINVTFLGKQNLEDVYRLIEESDLLVVPSRSENYPGVIVEAQLLGCAVVASKVGGIPEMIEDGLTGFLFEPNPRECMEAIERAISSPIISQIKIKAREQALIRHDETKINFEYETVIKDLIKS